jgi:hypothetical protein
LICLLPFAVEPVDAHADTVNKQDTKGPLRLISNLTMESCPIFQACPGSLSMNAFIQFLIFKCKKVQPGLKALTEYAVWTFS